MRVKEIVSDKDITLHEVANLLEEHTELENVGLINWKSFNYLPIVNFRIAHSNNQIWLKFYVKEKSVLAEVIKTNGGVANDSCVEFFFDPIGDGNYYNFEFNCIGITHLAYGPERNKRTYVNSEVVDNEIRTYASLGNKPFNAKNVAQSWELTIVIPASCLVHHEKILLKGLASNANFYKCGDKTAEPHYISWNRVETEQPDFHRPEYFAQIIFE